MVETLLLSSLITFAPQSPGMETTATRRLNLLVGNWRESSGARFKFDGKEMKPLNPRTKGRKIYYKIHPCSMHIDFRFVTGTKEATMLAIYKREGNQVIIRWNSKWNLRPADFNGISKINSITLVPE